MVYGKIIQSSISMRTNVNNIMPKYYRRVYTHRSTTWHAANM